MVFSSSILYVISLKRLAVSTSMSLFELICLRENISVFVPDNFLNKKDIELLIKFISAN